MLLISVNAYTQIEGLSKDTNVIWIADLELDFALDKQHQKDNVYSNDIGIIKYVNDDDWEMGETVDFFSNLIFKAISSNHFEVFEDNNLTKLANAHAAILRLDTNVLVDPITYETKLCNHKMPYKSSDVIKYRIHQLLYYNKQTTRFQLKSIAAAPLVIDVYNENGSVSLKPLFWFKTEDNHPDYNKKSIVWAQRLRTQRNSIDLYKTNVLKNTFDKSPLVHQFEVFLTDEKTPFYSYNYDIVNPMKENVPLQVRENILSTVDTFSVSNDIKIRIGKISADSIQKLRLIQEWYWDSDSKKLMIYLVGTAPIIAVKDEQGYFLYDKSLFYRKTNDD